MECGASDERNEDFKNKYTPEVFFKYMIDNSSPVIIDVGAHTGESVVFFKSIFPEAEIYSVEPDPASYEELLKVSPKKSNTRNVAISASSGMATFFQYEKSHLNSLYAINSASKDSLGYAESSKATEVEVQCITLNELVVDLGINAKKIDLLKIDAQGGECDVLSGAQDMLDNVDHVTLELSFYDFYTKKNTFLEIEKLLSKFELYSITKLSYNPKNFRTDWAEVFYKKIK